VAAPLSATRKAVLSLRWLAVITAVVLLSACAPGELPEGPLGKVQENHDVAGQPVQLGGADTIGLDAIFNSGSVSAVIDRLVLVSPRHIQLIGAYVTIGGIVGDWPTFPPSATGLRDVAPAAQAWARRHKPAGAIIPPHQWAGIALGLAPTSAAKARIAGIDVFYHVGSAHYEWHGHVQIVLTVVR
jgi:hypothetical protein